MNELVEKLERAIAACLAVYDPPSHRMLAHMLRTWAAVIDARALLLDTIAASSEGPHD